MVSAYGVFKVEFCAHPSLMYFFHLIVLALIALSEVLCSSVLVKSGLENRDYGRRGSAALTMRHPSIR
jgi:hypothetical protein